MGFGIRDVTRAVERGANDVANEIVRDMERTGDAAAGLGRQLIRESVKLGNRLPGGMKLGDRLPGRDWARGPRTPRQPFQPNDIPAPAPGDFPILSRGGQSKCGNLDQWGGGQPFPLIGFVPVAAGAQTQGTSIASFHLAASNPTIITADNLIPGNIEVFQAHLSVGVRLTTTLGFENQAILDSYWMIETVNGIERARWSLRQLALMAGVTGAITSGAATTLQRIDIPSIPWRRKYDPNVPHVTAIQPTRTFTAVSAMDFTFNEIGVRP